jgi:hypothetical protein
MIEYKTLSISLLTSDEIQKRLNSLNKKSWTVVTMSHDTVILGRRVCGMQVGRVDGTPLFEDSYKEL